MRRRTGWLLAGALALPVLLAGCGLLAEHVMQPPGRPFAENPAASAPDGQWTTGGDSVESDFMRDGDGTVAYNAMLFHTVEGTWQSEDGRFELTITGRINGAQMTLSLDGETAGECGMNFALLYLDRYPNPETELLKARGTLGMSGMSMSLAAKPVSELTSEEPAELIRKGESGPLPLTLALSDGTKRSAELTGLCHRQQTAEDSGTLHLTIRYEDETEETLTLTKP